jgi:hypothetical protein
MIASRSGHPEDSVKLAIPSLALADSLLSFPNSSVASVGRDEELGELRGFLFS